MMIDKYLQAETESEMLNALSFAIKEGKLTTTDENFSIVLIGDLYKFPESYDPTDPDSPQPIKREGFFANIRLCNGFNADLSAVLIDPQPVTLSHTFG